MLADLGQPGERPRVLGSVSPISFANGLPRRGDGGLSTPFAEVSTGVVVIVVAVVLAVVVLAVTLSMRGREKRREKRERNLADSAPPGETDRP
jgi:hypothetical protein